jgi:putative addiction module CopG family antidote
MPTQNVNLSEQQSKFIRQSVQAGRFRSASEAVRAGVHLLVQQEQQDKLKLATLRRLSREAFDEIDRGEFEVVDPNSLDAFLAKVDAKVRGAKAR